MEGRREQRREEEEEGEEPRREEGGCTRKWLAHNLIFLCRMKTDNPQTQSSESFLSRFWDVKVGAGFETLADLTIGRGRGA